LEGREGGGGGGGGVLRVDHRRSWFDRGTSVHTKGIICLEKREGEQNCVRSTSASFSINRGEGGGLRITKSPGNRESE